MHERLGRACGTGGPAKRGDEEHVLVAFSRMVHEAPGNLSAPIFNEVMRLYARREDHAAVRFTYEHVRRRWG